MEDDLNLSLDDMIRRQQRNEFCEETNFRQNSPLARRDTPKNGPKNTWKQNPRRGRNPQNRRNKPSKRWLSNSTLGLIDYDCFPSRSGSRLGPPSRLGNASVVSSGRESRLSVGSNNGGRMSGASSYRGSFNRRRTRGSVFGSQTSLSGSTIENNEAKFYVRLDPLLQAHIRAIRMAGEERITSLPNPALCMDPHKCVPIPAETAMSLHLRFSQFIVNECRASVLMNQDQD